MRFLDPKFRFTKRLGKVPEVQTVEFVIPAHVKLLALVGAGAHPVRGYPEPAAGRGRCLAWQGTPGLAKRLKGAGLRTAESDGHD